jgi:hypothetical protein
MMLFIILQCFVLALADGLCYALLVYPILVLVQVSGDRSSSIDWAQLHSFFLKKETDSSLRNVVF